MYIHSESDLTQVELGCSCGATIFSTLPVKVRSGELPVRLSAKIALGYEFVWILGQELKKRFQFWFNRIPFSLLSDGPQLVGNQISEKLPDE